MAYNLNTSAGWCRKRIFENGSSQLEDTFKETNFDYFWPVLRVPSVER